MYYNIEVINNININFIVIVVTRTQSPTRNVSGISVLNNDPDSRFVLAVSSQRKTDFKFAQIEYPQKANPRKLWQNKLI